MQALIKVTKNADGNQVVSARDLHTFLEIGRDFTNWCKKMFSYGFVENVDYAKTGESVNQYVTKHDYILTLDTAKHISMIQRTEKGMQARQYFIECEKKLTQVKQVVQPAIEKLQNRIKYLEAKLDSNERLHQQELRQLGFKLENNQSQLEFYRKNSDMLHEHWREAEERYFKENDMVMSMLEELVSLRRQVKALPVAQASVPDLPTTTKVRMMVDEHCKKTGSHQEAIWNELYLLMYYHYGLSVNRWTRPKGVSKLQEIERRGHGDKLLTLAIQHFSQSQSAA